MTRFRSTCLFYVAVFIIAPVLYIGFRLLFGDLISIILTAIIVIPLIFIEAIIRQSRIKNKLKQQKFLICPRCMIPVEKDPGICPNCGIQL